LRYVRFALIPFLFLKLSSGCVSGDLDSKYLVGTTFAVFKSRDSEHPDLNDVMFFANPVPSAKSIKIIEYRVHEWTLFDFVTGRLIGPFNDSHDFRRYLDREIASVPKTAGTRIIVDNIQIELDTNFFLELFDAWFTSLVGTYRPFQVVAEIAEIPEKDLTAYLAPETADTVKKEERPVEKVALFRGIVFSVVGREVALTSARPGDARRGAQITFVDRAGNQIGTGIVTDVLHTKVKVSLAQGQVLQGYSAFIYGN